MLIKAFLIIAGNLLFFFLFWKKLKEDYAADIIFTTAFYIVAGLIFAYILSMKFFPEFWFWFSFAGLLLGFLFALNRHKLRFMETFEAVIVAIAPALALLFLSDWIVNQNFHSLFLAIKTFVIFILFFLLDKHYKRFAWYKSGRIGFSGLTVMGAFFLLRAVVAMVLPFMLSFSGKYEVFLSGIVAFFSFMGVFNLARQKT